ncbi:MAG: aspartate ammonia-lyase [Deltaproteobacteria bacterium]|nr:aspartate ammonia-lyase [Deltaproteobacteria bacterium]
MKKKPLLRVRMEQDTLGQKAVPRNVYYGAQTQRAIENFPISNIKPRPVFIIATAMVKYSAAIANMETGLLAKRVGNAIIRASNEIIRGRLHDQFVVDIYQAGAGTSHNMNANEVIANRANELLGGEKGSYKPVHPNDHVNMSQSTNDVFPTAARLAIILSAWKLIKALDLLERELRRNSRRFDKVIKSGRTHLQDAVPIMLGQEFFSYAETIRKARIRISYARDGLKVIGLGATAAGTGINTHPLYRKKTIRFLRDVSGIKGLKPAPDLLEAINSMSDLAFFSSTLKNLSLELIRISNDLRLLGSGPRTGLAEIKLPVLQPCSSIMPGKVNPVLCEMLAMAAFQVVGYDLAVSLASQAGQLELNVMAPVISHSILESIGILTNAVNVFSERCVKGIDADRKKCRWYFENSLGLATTLNPYIGYEQAARLAIEAVKTNRTIKELVKEKAVLEDVQIKRLFDPDMLTRPMDKEKK